MNWFQSARFWPQAVGEGSPFLTKQSNQKYELQRKRSGYLFVAAGCMFFIAAFLSKVNYLEWMGHLWE